MANMESLWNHGWHGTQITRVACNKDPCNGENWCHMCSTERSVRPVTRTSYWNLALPSRRPNRWLRNSWSSPWHTASEERSPKIIEARPWKENKKSCCYSRYLRISFKSVVLCYFPSILMSRPCLFQALMITFHQNLRPRCCHRVEDLIHPDSELSSKQCHENFWGFRNLYAPQIWHRFNMEPD